MRWMGGWLFQGTTAPIPSQCPLHCTSLCHTATPATGLPTSHHGTQLRAGRENRLHELGPAGAGSLPVSATPALTYCARSMSAQSTKGPAVSTHPSCAQDKDKPSIERQPAKPTQQSQAQRGGQNEPLFLLPQLCCLEISTLGLSVPLDSSLSLNWRPLSRTHQLPTRPPSYGVYAIIRKRQPRSWCELLRVAPSWVLVETPVLRSW